VVKKDGWVPQAREIVWVQLNSQAGHEQAGHRPAIVLSPESYNRKTGLMLAVPMTTRVKGYPFEVAIAGAKDSVALADQVKCLDWKARGATAKGRVTADELEMIRTKLRLLVG
jgi:mRNA interferase MazF